MLHWFLVLHEAIKSFKLSIVCHYISLYSQFNGSLKESDGITILP